MATKGQIDKAITTLRMENYKILKPNELRCTCCGKVRSVWQQNWIMSNSPLHKGNTALYKRTTKNKETKTRIQSFAPICKKCIEDMYIKDAELPDLIETLRVLDKPYYKDTWDKIYTEKGHRMKPINMLGEYNSNIMMNFKDKTFKDSDSYDFDEEKFEKVNANVKLGKREKDELINKWGYHNSDSDLVFLRDKYKDWTTRHKCDEYSEEILFQQLSIKELEIRQGREKGENVDKQVDAFQKLLKDANVKPSDIKNSKTSDATACWGVFVGDIEKYKPAEYFEDKKIYEDFDKLREYAERFIYRPLKNLLTGSKDFDSEYSIRSDE